MSFQSFIQYTPETENNFQLTLAEMINDALGIIQVGVDGESIEPEYYERARVVANRVVLEMQTMGLHLSSYKVGYLFLQPDQYRYVIEDENATNTYYERTLSADEASGQTVLSVDDVTDLEVDDTIGITLDDGSIQWTTVSAVGADTVTIADALTDDAADGNYIFNYRVALRQISRIHQIWRRDNYVNDIPITVVGQQEYDALPYKTTNNGVPSISYYHRSIPKGTLFLWPVPTNAIPIMGFWYECKLGQLRDSTDVIDLDQFYIPFFVQRLALRCGEAFAISSEALARVKQTDEELMALALSYDDEGTPIKISPNRRV
jgi:hypothetical protein